MDIPVSESIGCLRFKQEKTCQFHLTTAVGDWDAFFLPESVGYNEKCRKQLYHSMEKRISIPMSQVDHFPKHLHLCAIQECVLRGDYSHLKYQNATMPQVRESPTLLSVPQPPRFT